MTDGRPGADKGTGADEPEAHEVCALIGAAGEILWLDPSGQVSSLPDSRTRWEAMWDLREALVEIAHSHPHGPLAFSSVDETAMAALGAALGRAPAFSVVSPTGYLRRDEAGMDTVVAIGVTSEPAWTRVVREASRMAPVGVGLAEGDDDGDPEHHV